MQHYILQSKKQPNVYYTRDRSVPSTTMIKSQAYVFESRSEAIMFKTPDWGIEEVEQSFKGRLVEQ